MDMNTATLVIAFLGACIAWGQWVTARSKLILDLFERRHDAYVEIASVIGAAARGDAASKAWAYERVLIQAQFLFGRRARDRFREMRVTLATLAGTASLLDGGGVTKEERARAAATRTWSMEELRTFADRFDDLVAPYLSMELKSPWSSRVTGWLARHRAFNGDW
jgi:hypothetical protein